MLERKNMTNLITEARELCAMASDIEWEAWMLTSELVGLHDARFFARSRTLIPELCDALEKAQGNLDAVWDMYQSAERELKKAQKQIESIRKALDFAETQRQKSQNYTELAINNGLALGRIAVTIQHDFAPLPAPPEEGAEHE